jgi:hypothetical protein
MLLTALMMSSTPAASQSSHSFISFISSPELTPDQNHYAKVLIGSEYVELYRYCVVDIAQLQQPTVDLELFDGTTYSVRQRKVDTRSASSFSWFGRNDDPQGSVVFTVNREHVTGWIHIGSAQYSIYPLGDGLHLMYKVKQTGQQDESDEGYRKMLERAIESQLPDKPEIDRETGLQKPHGSLLAGNCKVRVAVCYTDNVASALADELGFVQSCIDVTNDCYNNSSINFDVELAVTYENNYSETSDADADLDNFHDINDGVLDEIDDKRTYYDADLAVLVVENMDDYCGLAWTVAITDYDESYCVVKRTCAVDNYSFPHELGHLYGARHDCYVDLNIIPYACGHGYVNQADEWRTVMAYNNQCEDDGDDCERIPYFSNPDVDYLGDPTGTTCFWPLCEKNNEETHESSRDEIADNEVSVSDKVFPSETFFDGEGGDVIALESVTNSTTYDINSGAEVTWRAGTEIILAPGFTAEPGSVFNAYLDECTALRLEEEDASEGITRQSGYLIASAFPNPFSSETQLRLQVLKEGNLDIRLFDLSGKELMAVVPNGFFDSGTYSFVVNPDGLSDGVYILRVALDGEMIAIKITKST